MDDLTARQKQILEFIKTEIKSKGYPPSIREIADKVGLNSSGTVHSHLKKIEALGYIKKDPTKPRTIGILDNDNCDVMGFHEEIIELPVVDKIYGTSNPISKKNIVDTMKLPASLVLGTNNFILKHKDNSMVDAGILKEDFLIIDRGAKVKENKIAVFVIKYSKTVLGKYFENGDNIIIKPQNSFYDPLVIPKNEVNIIGRVTGVFRVIK